MDVTRLRHTFKLWMIPGAVKRAQYLKDKNVFASFGEQCSYMDRRVPLYAKLIKIGNNVHFAFHVTLLTHDVAHMMINRMYEKNIASEKVGCIEIGNNVFVGSNVTILYNVKIGNNVVIGAGSLVNKDVSDNVVVGGVPARVIGDFDSFVNRRITETNETEQPIGEYISLSLQSTMWDSFSKARNKL